MQNKEISIRSEQQKAKLEKAIKKMDEFYRLVGVSPRDREKMKIIPRNQEQAEKTILTANELSGWL